MTNIQDQYAAVAGGFDARVRATEPDKWDADSPCEGWKARDIVAHVVANHRGLIANVRGDEDEPVAGSEDPEAAWSDVYRRMSELTRDPAAMATTVESPIGPQPLEQVLGSLVCMDVLIHTWDLARAVGGDEKLDPAGVQSAYSLLTPIDAMIRQPGIFGPKLEPPAGADAQTSLLYFVGRRA